MESNVATTTKILWSLYLSQQSHPHIQYPKYPTYTYVVMQNLSLPSAAAHADGPHVVNEPLPAMAQTIWSGQG